MMVKNAVLVLCFLSLGPTLYGQTQWEELTAAADSLDLKMQFEESLPVRTAAIRAAAGEPDSIRQMLRGLQMFTQAEFEFGRTRTANEEAYAMMQEAAATLVNANAGPERISKAYWDLNLAAFNYMRNQPDTEKFLNKSIAYHLKSPEIDTLFLLNTMHGSAYMGILSGKYAQAIGTLEEGIGLFSQYQVKNDKDKDLKGYFYSNLALVHSPQFLNMPAKELHYLQEAERVFAEMEDPDLEYFIGTYVDLSKAEKGLRNYKNSEGYLTKALRLYEDHKAEFHTGTMHYVGFKKELEIYGNFLIVYRDTDNRDKMLEVFGRVEEIARNNEFDQTESNQYAGILQGIARYYLHQEFDLDQALAYIDKALQVHIAKTAIHFGDVATGLRLDRAQAFLLNKDYHRSLQLIEQLEPGHSLDAYQIELKVKNLLGLRNYDAANKAVNLVLAAISDENKGFSFPDSRVEAFTPGYVITDAEGLVGLAEAYRHYHGNYSAEEEKLYWLALRQLEANMGNTPLNKHLKKTFDKISAGLMEGALERDFSDQESSGLLTFMEGFGSQELISTFLLKREVAGSTELYQLVEEEQFIRSYITYLKKEYQKSADEHIRQQLFEKEQALRHLRRQLAEQYRHSSVFAAPEIDVQSPTGKNIIKFTLAGDRLFKTRIHQGKLSYQEITGYPALKREIGDYLLDLNNLTTPVGTLKSQGAALFERLFQDDFDTAVPTVILPDGILHYLPFELLVKDDVYLLRNHTISYAPNFYFLNAGSSDKGRVNGKKVAFFAPEYSGNIPENLHTVRGTSYSLAGATTEVQLIAKFVPGNLYLGDSASKSRFKSLDGNVSVLHLAMHSNLNDADPELSNLLFSSAEPDYEMYISELYGLNFKSDLAVLSACNTGIGGFQDGGNLVSMQQAFMIAGIPATVASLWNAPDHSTKEIMIAFYKNLQSGLDKASALREAKLTYLDNTTDENLQHPFYWAGFVLSGDASPIDLAGIPFWRTPSGIILASLLLILVVGGLVWRAMRVENLKNRIFV